MHEPRSRQELKHYITHPSWELGSTHVSRTWTG